jgi:large subunit ribosomal protein L11
MMDFCKKFNEETKNFEVNAKIPVIVYIFKDKTFDFKVRTPQVSFLFKKLNQVHKTYHIKSITLLDLYKIACVKGKTPLEIKRVMQSLVGSCKSMGLKIKSN